MNSESARKNVLTISISDLKGKFRAYLLEAGTDLFGAWLVDVTYGRIGTRGRRIRYVVEDENSARKLVRENLRRRATAKCRIGVAYEFRELVDPRKCCHSAESEPDIQGRSETKI